MQKQEALEQIKKLESELKKMKEIVDKMKEIVDKPEKYSKEKRFLELSNNLVRKYDFDKNPQIIKYCNQDNLLFKQDFEKGYLWCNYNRIWVVFEKEYGMGYNQIQDFIKDMVEKHFNWKGLTPFEGYWQQDV